MNTICYWRKNLWMIVALLCVPSMKGQGPSLSFGAVEGLSTQTNIIAVIAYGNGIFVAAGTGVTLTSSNGFIWKAHFPPTNDVLYGPVSGLAAGNGNFIAVGNSGSNGVVQISSDGSSWGQRITIPSVTFRGYRQVAYANGTYVAVGQASDGSALVATSYDGVHWSTKNFPAYGPLSAVTAGNGTFVAVGNSGAIFTSGDGFNWVTKVVLQDADIVSVAYGNGIFVAGAPTAFPNTILTSTNGADWILHDESKSSFSADEVYRMAYGNGLFVAQSNYLSVSTNGVDWKILLIAYGGESPVNDVAYGAGTFVIEGSYGPLVTLSPSYFLDGNREASGVVALTVNGGGPGQNGRVQATSILLTSNWVDVFNFTNQGATMDFLDTEATNYPQRFYRVVSP